MNLLAKRETTKSPILLRLRENRALFDDPNHKACSCFRPVRFSQLFA